MSNEKDKSHIKLETQDFKYCFEDYCETMLIVTESMEFLRVNDKFSEIFGYNTDDLNKLGLDCYELIYQDDVDLMLSTKKIVDSEKRGQCNIRCKTASDNFVMVTRRCTKRESKYFITIIVSDVDETN